MAMTTQMCLFLMLAQKHRCEIMSMLKVPLEISPSGGFARLDTLDKKVKQKIVDYLSTSTFEHAMYPMYGANTNALIFENYDSLFFEEFKIDALNGLRQHVSGVQILDLRLTPTNTATGFSTVTLSVDYVIPTFGKQQVTLDIFTPTDISEDF